MNKQNGYPRLDPKNIFESREPKYLKITPLVSAITSWEHPNGHKFAAQAATQTQTGLAYRVKGLVCEKSAGHGSNPGVTTMIFAPNVPGRWDYG